jgi:outer membrane murein-binding lipoprotein Lpp
VAAMRMVMERGCPDEYRTSAVESRVRALEARVQRLQEDLELLRLAGSHDPESAWEVAQARSS